MVGQTKIYEKCVSHLLSESFLSFKTCLVCPISIFKKSLIGDFVCIYSEPVLNDKRTKLVNKDYKHQYPPIFQYFSSHLPIQKQSLKTTGQISN